MVVNLKSGELGGPDNRIRPSGQRTSRGSRRLAGSGRCSLTCDRRRRGLRFARPPTPQHKRSRQSARLVLSPTCILAVSSLSQMPIANRHTTPCKDNSKTVAFWNFLFNHRLSRIQHRSAAARGRLMMRTLAHSLAGFIFQRPLFAAHGSYGSAAAGQPTPPDQETAAETAAEGDAKAEGEACRSNQRGAVERADDRSLERHRRHRAANLPQSHRHHRARADLRPGILPEVRADIGRRLAEARAGRRIHQRHRRI